MNHSQNQRCDAGQQLDTIKVEKIVVNLGNTFVRLARRDRRRVMRLLERFIYKKTGYSYYSWDLWTKDEMLVCYMKLQGISQQMANDWRRWASAHLKAGQNYRSAIRALLYTLVYALLSALKAEAKKEAERTRP